ncbi:substrate-binding periplasmic protein [Pseudoduganella ginsengisoli]|nr:transporter substrate-binding domain-containing protein [Pseudoduganella ginsengisoli]
MIMTASGYRNALAALVWVICTACAAAEQGPVPATLKVGLQNVIAPFVMPGQQTGLLVDVLRAAFATQHIAADFSYLPNVRFEQQLREGKVDVSTLAKPEYKHKGFLSHWPVTHFHNMAITVRSRIPALHHLDDLKAYRVTAFGNARKVLGREYDAAMAKNPEYREPATMPSASLILNRTDVIISQRDIFLYYLSQQMPEARSREGELAFHDIIGPGNLYWLSFRSEQQRDAFERGIAELYASGEIDQIIARYQKEFGTTRDFFLPLDCQFRPAQAPKACKDIARRQ